MSQANLPTCFKKKRETPQRPLKEEKKPIYLQTVYESIYESPEKKKNSGASVGRAYESIGANNANGQELGVLLYRQGKGGQQPRSGWRR